MTRFHWEDNDYFDWKARDSKEQRHRAQAASVLPSSQPVLTEINFTDKLEFDIFVSK